MRIVEMRDAYEAAYRHTIQDGVEEGVFSSEVDPGITAIFILSVLNALIRWYRPSGDRSAEEISAEMWSFVRDGITGATS